MYILYECRVNIAETKLRKYVASIENNELKISINSHFLLWISGHLVSLNHVDI